jgi:uncharacterized Rmd1/YagE family protein
MGMNKTFKMVYVATPRKDPNRILKEMVEILRKENQQLEHQVRVSERAAQRIELFEAAIDNAMLAVRILAKAVSSKTATGKKARAEARQLLEERGLRPPGTLGSSRVKRRRRKRPLDRAGSA